MQCRITIRQLKIVSSRTQVSTDTLSRKQKYACYSVHANKYCFIQLTW